MVIASQTNGGLIARAATQWRTMPYEPCVLPNPCQGLDSTSLLRGLRRKAHPQQWDGQSCAREPEVQQARTNITALRHQIGEWSQGVAQDGCNAKQAEVCRRVECQVLEELSSDSLAVEPLRWAVHGGPGTGKSYVLNRIRKELFEDILSWKQGPKVTNSKL